MRKLATITLFAALLAALPSMAAGGAGSAGDGRSAKARSIEDKKVGKHIATFDDLDFNVFSNQKWQDLHKSHSKDIKVHWPDGHVTTGIDQHIEDLKYMFTYAPDTRVTAHPVKFGDGDWTSVIGTMEAKPMVLPGGKTIQPTGKPVKLWMATVGHWNKDGVMDEEYLFWDNATYMKSFGIQ
jgi:SnoaL-like polyketide cyclase